MGIILSIQLKPKSTDSLLSLSSASKSQRCSNSGQQTLTASTVAILVLMNSNGSDETLNILIFLSLLFLVFFPFLIFFIYLFFLLFLILIFFCSFPFLCFHIFFLFPTFFQFSFTLCVSFNFLPKCFLSAFSVFLRFFFIIFIFFQSLLI